MRARERVERIGNWLFRQRSYLPLLMAGLFLVAMRNFRYPGGDHALDRAWELFCLGLSLLGLGIRIVTIGSAPRRTSGRNTKKQVADQLTTTGMYSITRHPLYLGNFIIWSGVVLSVRSWWFTMVAMVLFWLCYSWIIFAEEEFLRRKFGGAYQRWVAATPAIVPDLHRWRTPKKAFSFRKALRHEYRGFFAIVVAFTALELVEQRWVEGRVRLDALWVAILVGGTLIAAVLRVLEKKTGLLDGE